MPSPLVRDDNPDEPEQPPQREPLISPEMVQKGENFWSTLRRFGGWLSKQRLPPAANAYLKEEARKMWTGDKGPSRKKPQKWTAQPFRSFTPKEKKRKGKL